MLSAFSLAFSRCLRGATGYPTLISMDILSYIFLRGRSFLRLKGEDTKPFLQGIVTADTSRLSPDRALYALLLTPQGKYLHDFFLTQRGESVLLECSTERREDLSKRLRLYKLRSRVEIEMVEGKEYTVAAVFGDAEKLGGLGREQGAYADPRLARLGFRVVQEEAETRKILQQRGAKEVSVEDYNAWRIACGVPEGGLDLEPERSLPLEYGLDTLQAVDFRKGCYVGQEVTARMRYRAHIRKHLFCVRTTASALPGAGAPVKAGEAIIGYMGSSQGPTGLALLNAEQWSGALQQGVSLSCGGITLSAQLPPWWQERI